MKNGDSHKQLSNRLCESRRKSKEGNSTPHISAESARINKIHYNLDTVLDRTGSLDSLAICAKAQESPSKGRPE